MYIQLKKIEELLIRWFNFEYARIFCELCSILCKIEYCSAVQYRLLPWHIFRVLMNLFDKLMQ